MLTDDQDDVEDLKEHDFQFVGTGSMGRGGRGGQDRTEIFTSGLIPSRAQRQRRQSGCVDFQAERANVPRSVEDEKTRGDEDEHPCDAVRLSMGARR